MHERTQRAVARLLFVFCCAVPSCLVLLAVLVSLSPWYQSRKLAELTYRLGRETGLEFKIDRCERIAPGRYTLKNVEVTNPDSKALIAKIRLVDYVRTEAHVGIFLHQPELQSAGLGDAWKLLHDRLICRPAQTVLPISIAATDVNVRSRLGSLPPTELRAEITPEGESVRMVATAEDPLGNHGMRMRFELYRNRELADPATELVFSTEGTALPCSALAEYSKAIKNLGTDALFTGVIRCQEVGAGWSYDLGGSSLSNMNLDDLTSELPDRVIGRAELRLLRCNLRPGESVNLAGTLTTPKTATLRLDATTLAKLRDHLGMLIDERELAAPQDGIECKMSIHFEIRDQTLTLNGIGGEAALYARGRAVAWTAPEPVDADRITAMLSPPSRWLAAWNQIFLPTAPSAASSDGISGRIRAVRSLDKEPTVWQR